MVCGFAAFFLVSNIRNREYLSNKIVSRCYETSFRLKEFVDIFLFAFPKTENKIDGGTQKGYGGDDAPEGFFAHSAEIFMQAVDYGPYRQKKEGYRQQHHNAGGL